MVMKLVPEPVDFLIPTTDIKVIYTESNGVQIYLDVQTQEDFKTNNYQEWMLCFSVVAELKCTTLNFFESHFDDIQFLAEASISFKPAFLSGGKLGCFA